jgi:hypothetical protein
MTTPSVASIQQKINLIKKDLYLRKHRAMHFCSPNIHNDFTPSCEIIWKSIYNDESYLKAKCSEKKIEL